MRQRRRCRRKLERITEWHHADGCDTHDAATALAVVLRWAFGRAHQGAQTGVARRAALVQLADSE